MLNSSDENHIAAQLEGGELLVRLQLNGSLEAYTVSGVKLNNGENHLIEVSVFNIFRILRRNKAGGS